MYTCMSQAGADMKNFPLLSKANETRKKAGYITKGTVIKVA